MCLCVYVSEHRFEEERTVTSLIKRESLHCSACRHHHRQTSLITLSKCRFVQAISPLLFAYANMTDLIISFYISHTPIVIVKTAAWSQGRTHSVLSWTNPPLAHSLNPSPTVASHSATCVMRFCRSKQSHVVECHGSIIC